MTDHLAKALANVDAQLALALHSKAAQPSPLPTYLSAGVSDGAESKTLNSAREQYSACASWVYAAGNLISTRIAGQEIKVARNNRRSKLGGFATKALRNSLPSDWRHKAAQLEPLESHPVLDLLHDPAEQLTQWSLLYPTIFSLQLTGQAFWLTDEDGGRKQLYPLPSSWVEVNHKSATWKIRLPDSTEDIPTPAERFVHFLKPAPWDPRLPLSPVAAWARSINCDDAISTSQTGAFLHGINPSLALIVGKQEQPSGAMQRPTLTKEQRQQLVNSVLRQNEGLHKRHIPLILDGMIDQIQTLSRTPAEMDYLASKLAVKNEILQGAFSVSPILLGEVENTSYAAYNVADEIFCAGTINPTITMLSQVLSEWLSAWFQEDLTIWIERAVAHNAEMEFKRMTLLANKGRLTPNELRSYAGLPPIKGGDKLPGADKSFRTLAKRFKSLDPYTAKRNG